MRPTGHHRNRPYYVISFLLVVAAVLLPRSGTNGGVPEHTLTEVAAYVLAGLAGTIALLAYFSRRDLRSLVIGCTLVGAASLESVHAFVTAAPFMDELPGWLQSFMPWSELGSRFYLGVGMLAAAHPRFDGHGAPRITRAVVATAVAGYVGTFLVLSFVPTGGRALEISINISAGVLLAGALVAWSRRPSHEEETFDRWILFSLLFAAAGQLLFAAQSTRLFDPMFVADHALKSVSFSCALVAFFTTVYRAFRRVEELGQQNARILDSAAEGIIGVDERGRIVFANTAAQMMLRLPEEQMIGADHHNLFHHSHPDRTPYEASACPITLTADVGEASRSSDEVFWRSDGAAFPVELVAAPFEPHGRRGGAVVVFRDISERKALEELKSDFVSIVSHELRTPLTSMKGALSLIADEDDANLSATSRRMVQVAMESSDRLVHLVNDILDVEGLDSGRIKINKEHVELSPLIEKAVEGLAGLSAETGVHIEVMPAQQLWVDADPHRITQVMTNLIGNACKFSPSGARVDVEVLVSDYDALVRVKDRGRGIPADRLEAVFDRFHQIDASDRSDKGGTGLGLAIARGIVNQHGGRIWAESMPGQGSTFSFTLPLRAREPDKVTETV